MSHGVPETDWKTLRRLEPTLLNRLCERILADVAKIGSRTGTPHERYRRVYELLRKRDKDLGHAFDNLRRSTAVTQMAVMRSLNLFTEDEFMQLSAQTRDWIEGLLSISRSK